RLRKNFRICSPGGTPNGLHKIIDTTRLLSHFSTFEDILSLSLFSQQGGIQRQVRYRKVN
ncbi:hypothetical protein, partial [Desulfurobacterium indicum]|uniref:hypothetical protein n=1 Tax=Desulfurobacterium indicum TaxID=1914305 RepID=UPI001C1F4E3C